jgi:hypothetical protein
MADPMNETCSPGLQRFDHQDLDACVLGVKPLHEEAYAVPTSAWHRDKLRRDDITFTEDQQEHGHGGLGQGD